MKNKKLFSAISFFALLLLFQPLSFAQSWQWAVKGGGPLSDKGTDIDIDGAGNLYMCGYYNADAGGVSFGGIAVPMSFGKEGYAAKINSNGIWMWANGAVGGYDERVLGLCTDKLNGAVYATGTTWAWSPNDYLSFGNCNSFNNPGAADEIFVSKFDLNGNCQWQIGAGSSGDDHGFDLVTDKQGNIFLTGFHSNYYSSGYPPAMFGSISTPLPFGTDSMAFVTKISPAGVFQWVRTFEAVDGERDNRLAVDSSGNVYVVGGFHGTKVFGSETVVSKGDIDIFVIKFDSNGNQVWVRTAGSTLSDRANGITFDPFNNIYITGEFRDKVAFGSDTINNYGGPNGRDIFVARMKTDGTWVWAKRAGSTSGQDRGNSIVANDRGNIFITGQFTGTAKFGSNITLFNTSANPNVFVAAIDTLGKWKWALHGESIDDSRGTGITCDSCTVYISGYFRNSATFGSVNLNSAGGRDAFAASIINACFDYCYSESPVVTASDNAICYGDTITLQVEGGNTFVWSPAADLSCASCDMLTAAPIVTTLYSVIASNNCGIDSANIIINVFDRPAVTATASPNTITNGEQSTLSGNSGPVSYLWSPSTTLDCNTCAVPTANPIATTTYILTVTDANGCTAIDSVIVNVIDDCKDLFVPTVFSPNGDGLNDEQCVLGNCIETMLFTIYDRWGEKIFESNDPGLCWDGTFKGQLMNTGTLVYVLEALLTNGKTISQKGNFTLVR